MQAPVVSPKRIGWGCVTRYPNPLPNYDQNLPFSLAYLWPDQNFDTLFNSVAAGTVALNTIYEGLLLMGLSIMMEVWLLLKNHT